MFFMLFEYYSLSVCVIVTFRPLKIKEKLFISVFGSPMGKGIRLKSRNRCNFSKVCRFPNLGGAVRLSVFELSSSYRSALGYISTKDINFSS